LLLCYSDLENVFVSQIIFALHVTVTTRSTFGVQLYFISRNVIYWGDLVKRKDLYCQERAESLASYNYAVPIWRMRNKNEQDFANVH
jgi:hypothetical protein